jgi:hypothetical protein
VSDFVAAKIHVKVPVVQSHSPVLSNESGDRPTVTERATGFPSLIHDGSIGIGRRSVRDVSKLTL